MNQLPGAPRVIASWFQRTLPRAAVFGLVFSLLTPHAFSQDAPALIPGGELSNAQIADIVRAQAAELAAQRALIEKQQGMLESQRQVIEKQQQELAAQRDALNALQAGKDQPAPATAPVGAAGTLPAVAGPQGETPVSAPVTSQAPAPIELAATPDKIAEEEEVARKAAKARDDDPLLGYDPSRFPGGIPLPGTAAALRIGGYVKANVVQSFEAVGTQDRFIVGSIPTDPAIRGDSEAALTASQSRLNFELREDSPVGQFRAFIEGDFAGTGDSFRLRHAFGQFGSVLAGKTWSTFMDTEASPEEVDFEGINGRINLRRTQFRYFPTIAQQWNLAIALEDPSVVVQGGDGLSQVPDLVMSAKRSVRGGFFSDREWHLKLAALFRNIRARPDVDTESKESATGWGVSLSGKTDLEFWGARDSLMFQINYGQGYSSYVNDLSTIDMPDAAFDPLTGDLVTVDALAWYLAVQHWWRETIRSNFIVSQVDVSSQDFVITDSFGVDYQDTWRASANLIWSPWPRVNVGGEVLWGERSNRDGESGNATQLQLSVKYLF